MIMSLSLTSRSIDSIETYGDLSPHCAKAYFEYGNALLTKEEETSAQGVLGNVDNEKEGGKEDDVLDDEDDEDGEANADGDDGNDGDEEAAGDLQIAWEVLDVRGLLLSIKLLSFISIYSQVARSILAKEPDSNKNRLLSEVYVRLGDVRQMNEDISGSLLEYESALKIREVVCDPSDR